MQLVLLGFLVWSLVTSYVFATSQQCLGKSFGRKVAHPTQRDTYYICLGKVGELEQKCAENYYFAERSQRCLRSRNALETTNNDGNSNKCNCCQQQLLYMPLAVPMIAMPSCACTCYQSHQSEPITDEPTTTPPITDEPTTIPPITDEPTTQPITDEPTTTPPITDKPTTQPITDEPTTTPPITDEPTTTPPITDEPTTTPPITDEPTKTPLITDKPTTTPPITDEPTTTPPITDEPTTTPPITDKPTTTPPITDEPTTTQPITDEPTTTQPIQCTCQTTTPSCSTKPPCTTSTPCPCMQPTTPSCTTPTPKITDSGSGCNDKVTYPTPPPKTDCSDGSFVAKYQHTRPNTQAMLAGKCVSIPPDCTRYFDGTFIRDNAYCHKYYICMNGAAIPRSCPRGLYFDDKIMACNYAALVYCVNCQS